ncbi:hypothetical protein [Streptomyces sp. NPDC002463]|uniref:hypothetical protein n=1 Tax=Streptomyces sp. NPDC002463 TaxID=3364645 RepID=UPI0036CF7F84
MTTRLPTSGAKRALAVGAALISGATALVTAHPAMASATAHHPHRTDYVALGDSYASAPLVPDQVDASCGRSSNNYPSPVARSSAATKPTDVTCSGRPPPP